MKNKGTQALLESDVRILRENFGVDTSVSVSTTDVDGVRRMRLPLKRIFPPIVDIPYEKADFFASRLGFDRRSVRYKLFALSSLLAMFFQMTFSAFSAVLVKAGFHGFYRSEILTTMKNCDLVVSYSDENFKEAASYLPLNMYWVLTWWSMLVSRTWDILVAKYFSKPVVMFPNSVGPFRTFMGRMISRLALNACNIILVREPNSYRIVESLGIDTPKVLTFDTTWTFKSSNSSQVKVNRRPCIGVSLGFYAKVFSDVEIRKQAAVYAEAFDEVIRRFGCYIVLMPHYISGFRYDDLEISKMVMGKMKSKDNVEIVEVETADEFKSFLGEMDMVISAKMHPAVLALSEGVPTLCIAYDHKQTGLFDRLDMCECVLPIYEFSKEKLLSRISYVWNNSETIKARLALRVPVMQRSVEEATRRALFFWIDIPSGSLQNANERSE
jgi:polysaccharide pyruvyl transferase WcaK-like protein